MGNFRCSHCVARAWCMCAASSKAIRTLMSSRARMAYTRRVVAQAINSLLTTTPRALKGTKPVAEVAGLLAVCAVALPVSAWRTRREMTLPRLVFSMRAISWRLSRCRSPDQPWCAWRASSSTIALSFDSRRINDAIASMMINWNLTPIRRRPRPSVPGALHPGVRRSVAATTRRACHCAKLRRLRAAVVRVVVQPHQFVEQRRQLSRAAQVCQR